MFTTCLHDSSKAPSTAILFACTSVLQGEDSLSKQLRELQHAKEEAAAQVAQSPSVLKDPEQIGQKPYNFGKTMGKP